jgi:hypothetical protein
MVLTISEIYIYIYIYIALCMHMQNLIVAVEALVVVVVAVVGVVVEEVNFQAWECACGHGSSPTQEAHSLAVPCAHAMVACTAAAAGGEAAGAPHNNPWSQTDAR